MAAAAKIAVIGAGIGGLAAALALLRRGLDVDVYEQAPKLGEVGAGIQISSNGSRVLYALGLAQAVDAIAVRPPRRQIRHWSTGETWDWLELGATTAKRYGTPHLMLHRADLHGVLADAVHRLKPDAVHLGNRCVEIGQSKEQVEIAFADGARASAAYLIGADGIHSSVREHLFGPDKPQFTGVVAWRAVVPMQSLPPHISRTVGTNWLGPKGHVLHYPIRRGELMNFISLVERDDWRIESWTVAGTRDELACDYPGWHGDVHAIIENITTPFKWALMVRPPMPRWSQGRITLLGDACHPTLPLLGQGGVMAIEDGYVVAACLEKYFEEPATAFARYEDLRKERTAAVVRTAHENRKQVFSPALADKEAIAVSVAREWQQIRLRERMDWLYAYDATAAEI